MTVDVFMIYFEITLNVMTQALRKWEEWREVCVLMQ